MKRQLLVLNAAALVGGLVAFGCSGGGGGGGGVLPPPAAPAPPSPPEPPAPPAGTGSNFWYVGDTFGNPLKTHNGNEASLASQVLTLVNNERTSRGLTPYGFDPQAEVAAKAHAEDMLGRAYFAHDTPEGWDPGDRLMMLEATGYTGWGENIAAGQADADAVMAAWMGSTGHRNNILSTSHTHIGVGVAEGPPIHWVQVFTRRP